MNDVDRRRVLAAFFLLAAPALIALGAMDMAGAKADATVGNHGPSISTPAHHDAFPQQHNTPQPGTSEHHHHQKNH
jgi:hypothetical protein